MKKKVITIAAALFIISLCTGSVKAVASEKAISGFSAYLEEYYKALAEKQEEDSETVTLSEEEKLLPIFSNMVVANVSKYVNVRKSASAESDIVGRLYKGGVATEIETKDGWTKIVSGNVTGYVSSTYLFYGDAAEAQAVNFYDNYVYVCSDSVNARKGPGTDNAILTTLTKGYTMKVLERQNGWVKVVLSGIKVSQDTGWVCEDYLTNQLRYAVTKEEADAIDLAGSYYVNNITWPYPWDHNVYTYYGPRKAPTAGASTYHKGLDLGGSYGAPIVAAMSGTVTYVGNSSTAGRYVEITHPCGFVTRYLHNSKVLVSIGQNVVRGEKIAECGSSGVATGPHLHFSMTLYGESIDPYQYLKYCQ